MNSCFLLSYLLLSGLSNGNDLQPLASSKLVFAEVDGMAAGEAEHFFQQTHTDQRAFHVIHESSPKVPGQDDDPKHLSNASGGAYLEILPDTRRNHSDKLINGENFQPKPGKQAVLSYKVRFKNTGRYYVWVRAYSTGSEDNGLHVGIDGHWPDSGQRLQWCQGKHSWRWESKQRTEANHCGEAGRIFLDIDEPGEHIIHFSMREDGFEFDKWLLTMDDKFPRPADAGPAVVTKSGTLPTAFSVSKVTRITERERETLRLASVQKQQDKKQPVANKTKAQRQNKPETVLLMRAKDYTLERTGFYPERGKWAAVDPKQIQMGRLGMTFTFPTGKYDVTLRAVGENDGQSTYIVKADDQLIGEFLCPLSKQSTETGAKFQKTWKNVTITEGTVISVTGKVGSIGEDLFSRARWSAVAFQPADAATQKAAQPFLEKQQEQHQQVATLQSPTVSVSKLPLMLPRKPDGNGSVAISGELKRWHKITFTLDGPYAHEQDNTPNPFTDYRCWATFQHTDGTIYKVPGYFAADGNAAETGATNGTKWKFHFAADRSGSWNYKISMSGNEKELTASGDFTIAESDKTGRDLRSKGRLQVVGRRYLKFADSDRYFLKIGADAPETLLGYADFDGTISTKKHVPLKTYSSHMQDWGTGDPTWKNGKGKGLIGAVNYLSNKGCNAFSFLTYNAGGDGDNVWPYIDRNDKLHFDCSKLDQWSIVFDHATAKGMYLHFKLQETENDDHFKHQVSTGIPECLDNGDLGPQRKAYLYQLIARFGHNLALNWNLGEENTQTTTQQNQMINFISEHDAYDHNIVIHTYPNDQDKVYGSLIGNKSGLTGASLQNSGIQDTHRDTLKWVRASQQAGKPWIVAFDESGTAAHGQCPDLGYKGYDGKDDTGKMTYTEHDVRHKTLWGNLMAGGAGCEYYFGYRYVENDLLCEDWRSRDRSWDYGRIAINFFQDHVPFYDMQPADDLIGNEAENNSKYCLAKPGEVYVVYLPKGGSTKIELPTGTYSVDWFNPRDGGDLQAGISITETSSTIGDSPHADHDWVALIRKKAEN